MKALNQSGLIEKILYRLWYVKLDKTNDYMSQYEKLIQEWAKNDFGVEPNTKETVVDHFNEVVLASMKY